MQVDSLDLIAHKTISQFDHERMLNVLICDDEPLGRERIRTLLETHDDVKVAA